ncbi:hypothetical protein HK102_008256 [Quaeritorhiza haematococci]|nr:hypothetical protein HK102_008256 [Quaeritorhiza haematococci]
MVVEMETPYVYELAPPPSGIEAAGLGPRINSNSQQMERPSRLVEERESPLLKRSRTERVGNGGIVDREGGSSSAFPQQAQLLRADVGRTEGELGPSSGQEVVKPWEVVVVDDSDEENQADANPLRKQQDQNPGPKSLADLKGKQKEQKEQDSEKPQEASKSLNAVQEHLQCPICFNLFVAPHTVTEDWVNKSHKSTCPSCRSKITGKPIPSHTLQNVVDVTAPSILSKEEQEEREERLKEWREAKARNEEESRRGSKRRRRGRSADLNEIQTRAQLLHRLQQRRQRYGHQQRGAAVQAALVNVDALQYMMSRARNAGGANNANPVEDGHFWNGDGVGDNGDRRNVSVAVEYARSGRSSCATCQALISNGIMRFQVTDPNAEVPWGGGSHTRYHHIECYASQMPGGYQRQPNLIQGFRRLAQRDQIMLNALFDD